MKKLYTFAVALATAAFFASAASPQLQGGVTGPVGHAAPAFKIEKKQAKKAPAKIRKATSRLAPAEAPELADILGGYTISYLDEAYTGRFYEYQTSIEVGAGANGVIVNVPFDLEGNSFIMDVAATYEDGVLTIPTGQSILGVTFEVSTWSNMDGEYIPRDYITAEWNGSGFTFDEDDAMSLVESEYIFFYADCFELGEPIKIESPDITGITGEYSFRAVDEDAYVALSGRATIALDDVPGQVVLNLPFTFPDDEEEMVLDIHATYADGVLSVIPEQEIQGYYFLTCHWAPTYDEIYFADGIKGKWNGNGFTFDGDDIFVFNDDNGEIAALFDEFALTVYSDPNIGWSYFGEDTFQDGWLMPALGIDPEDPEFWYPVELQQNDDNENVYRLVNPYKGEFILGSFNQSAEDGYIQFDVTDPDHVTFAPVSAGFSSMEFDLPSLYCSNQLSSLAGMYGVSPEEIIADYGDEILYTTFKDGVVTLSSVDKGDGNYFSDACFDTVPFGLSGWATGSDKGANMLARIFFPSIETGVNKVAVDAAAPVEYFNLQGVRVENPSAGLFIRRQGNAATKVLIK